MNLYFDTETTGLRPGKICQLSYILQDESGAVGKNMFFHVGYVEPSAAAVHGFTAEVLYELSQGRVFADRFGEIAEDFRAADMLIAHNFSFDFMFMSAEFERLGERFTYKNSLCSMKKFTPVCRLPRANGTSYKYPKLSELCEFLDIYPYDVTRETMRLFRAAPSAHDARYDTAALYPGETYAEKLKFYFSLYEKFRTAALREGIRPFLGSEVRAYDAEGYFSEYLLYGVDEKFFYDNPALYALTQRELFSLAEKNGVFMVQSHPFRTGVKVGYYEYMHGVEVYNGHKYHTNRNFVAKAFAEGFGLRQTGGTDFHMTEQTPVGGIYLPENINTDRELADYLFSSQPRLIRDKDL